MIFKFNLFYMIEILNDLWNSIRTFNETALIVAIKNDYADIVEILLKQNGIDVNMKDILNQKHLQNYNLTFFHDIEIYNDLWDLIEAFNDTALIFAAWRGHTKIVEMLLKQKDIDVNIKDILNQKHL